MEEIKQIIHCDFEKVAKWFYESYMMLNQGKCHIMYLERNTENKAFVFKNRNIKNSEEKIWALARLSRYLNDAQKSLIFNLVIRTQLNYCPIVWLFCLGQTNTMINKLHKRVLRIALNDQIRNFETLLAESSENP